MHSMNVIVTMSNFALVKLLDDWITAIDNNEIMGTLFLDL